MTAEQIREIARHVVSLGVDAPIESVIRTYELLARLMPTDEERKACERIALTYQEAADLQTKARLPFERPYLRPPELRAGEVFLGQTPVLAEHTLDLHLLEDGRWFRVTRLAVDALPSFKSGVHLAVVLGVQAQPRN